MASSPRSAVNAAPPNAATSASSALPTSAVAPLEHPLANVRSSPHAAGSPSPVPSAVPNPPFRSDHLQPPSLSVLIDRVDGTDASRSIESESPSPSRTGSPRDRSPQWFGASHYDQVDASFAKDAADVAVTAKEEKEERDVFARHKNRLGKTTYLVAPSAKNGGSAIAHIQQHERQADANDVHRGGGGGGREDRDQEKIPAAVEDGLTHRRSTAPTGPSPGSAAGNPTPAGTDVTASTAHVEAKLAEWPSTAICANDITSSCFYAISITTQAGGIFAPLCFLFVVFVLYLFRNVYGEAVTALPLNGGAYNVLLNTTNKKVAGVASCLSLLSYMATGVVSAASAISYLQYIAPAIPISGGVVILLGIFALLTLWGIRDSSRVAYAIMTCHMSTMAALILTMIVFLCRNPSSQQFTANIHSDVNPSVPIALLYGYASAMLGVTGFETSANFVEEQQDGVFVKTLRNMWILVSIINPSLALLTVLILPLDTIVASANVNVLLAFLGDYAGGSWLKYWVSIDAFLVLAASVLTAFIGMNGLARRVALDRGLPQVLLRTNRWRHTNHWIIISFFLICISLYFIVSGDTDSLGNVYAISFLLVMSGFAIVLLALTLVLVALGGVIAKEPSILAVWIVYFVIVLSGVGVMFFRVHLLQVTFYAVAHISAYFGSTDNALLRYIKSTAESLVNQPAIFFTKYGRLAVLNQAVLYLLSNEEASRLYIVHLYQDEADIPPKLLRHVSILDQEYAELTVELVLVNGQFDGPTVDWLSRQLKVSKNMMFLTCPKQDFKIKLASLGGVRLIAR